MPVQRFAMQFKIALKGINPSIWRRVVVPAEYSFWDLHVAIQDAMGWQDSHLHLFRVKNVHSKSIDLVGIPDDDVFEGDPHYLPGWDIPLTQYFRESGDRAAYEYDFGDGWEHELLFEKITPRNRG